MGQSARGTRKSLIGWFLSLVRLRHYWRAGLVLGQLANTDLSSPGAQSLRRSSLPTPLLGTTNNGRDEGRSAVVGLKLAVCPHPREGRGGAKKQDTMYSMV